jgi:hypothetical protein
MRHHEPTVELHNFDPNEVFLKKIAQNLSRANNAEAAVMAFGEELKVISNNIGDDLQSKLLPVGKSV